MENEFHRKHCECVFWSGLVVCIQKAYEGWLLCTYVYYYFRFWVGGEVLALVGTHQVVSFQVNVVSFFASILCSIDKQKRWLLQSCCINPPSVLSAVRCRWSLLYKSFLYLPLNISYSITPPPYAPKVPTSCTLGCSPPICGNS